MLRKSPSIEFIQAFRGIAALIVVLWHGSRFVTPYGSWLGEALFGVGSNMGVDLFFLISGFVMVITSKPGHVREFAVRRLTRILPVYFFMTFAYVFLLKGGLSYLESRPDLLLLGHSLSFIPSAGDAAPTFAFPTLVVGWTLNYEMYFYLIFGISLLFGRFRWAFLFGYFAFTLIAIPAAFSTFTLSPESNYSFGVTYFNLITNPIIWLFLGGVTIGLIYKSHLVIRRGFYANLLLFTSVGFVVWQYMAAFRAGHGIAQWGLSLIPLMIVFVLVEKGAPIRVPQSLVYLGNISFSLYLVHPIVQEGLQIRMGIMGISAYATGWPMLLATTWLSVCLACLSHRFVEAGLGTYLTKALLRPAPSLLRSAAG